MLRLESIHSYTIRMSNCCCIYFDRISFFLFWFGTNSMVFSVSYIVIFEFYNGFVYDFLHFSYKSDLVLILDRCFIRYHHVVTISSFYDLLSRYLLHCFLGIHLQNVPYYFNKQISILEQYCLSPYFLQRCFFVVIQQEEIRTLIVICLK